jgi:hypothetical protein
MSRRTGRSSGCSSAPRDSGPARQTSNVPRSGTFATGDVLGSSHSSSAPQGVVNARVPNVRGNGAFATGDVLRSSCWAGAPQGAANARATTNVRQNRTFFESDIPRMTDGVGVGGEPGSGRCPLGEPRGEFHTPRGAPAWRRPGGTARSSGGCQCPAEPDIRELGHCGEGGLIWSAMSFNALVVPTGAEPLLLREAERRNLLCCGRRKEDPRLRFASLGTTGQCGRALRQQGRDEGLRARR